MDTQFEVPRHPIGVAAERTGLSTDLIRAWERRYGATEPDRDASGQRLYSDADVERLTLLRRATEGGRSIGQVAGLERAALTELVRGDEAARAERLSRGGSGEANHRIEALESLAKALDGQRLEVELRSLLLERGFVEFAETVAAPLLRRLGEGWHAGRITTAQEHVASAAVRRVLESTVSTGPDGDSAPVIVAGTLPDERHETGVLVVAAAARLSGWRVVYVGADLPVADLVSAARATGARAVAVSGTYMVGGELVSGIRELRAALPGDVELFAGGPAVEAEREALEGLGVRCPGELASLREALEQLASEPSGAGGRGR
ncbi:MAG: MerR family transcriptional regulator [Gemmatimonadota bacterium]|jgi:DNA-binding transcriptional MerR regulator/methylmalonyl-CoA mutase cobalamin-binding subunit